MPHVRDTLEEAEGNACAADCAADDATCCVPARGAIFQKKKSANIAKHFHTFSTYMPGNFWRPAAKTAVPSIP